jgi:hypothetical protein
MKKKKEEQEKLQKKIVERKRKVLLEDIVSFEKLLLKFALKIKNQFVSISLI